MRHFIKKWDIWKKNSCKKGSVDLMWTLEGEISTFPTETYILIISTRKLDFCAENKTFPWITPVTFPHLELWLDQYIQGQPTHLCRIPTDLVPCFAILWLLEILIIQHRCTGWSENFMAYALSKFSGLISFFSSSKIKLSTLTLLEKRVLK